MPHETEIIIRKRIIAALVAPLTVKRWHGAVALVVAVAGWVF